MKNSNFGQGKKVPPQFNDYMNIFRGLEDIIKAAFNQAEQRMLIEFRDVLSSTQDQQIRAEIVQINDQQQIFFNMKIIKDYMNQQKNNVDISLDKFDLYMMECFEGAYISHKRQVHYRSLKQLQKRQINFEKLEFSENLAVNSNNYFFHILKNLKQEINQAIIEFDEYINSFVESVVEQVEFNSQNNSRKQQIDQIISKSIDVIGYNEKFLNEFSINI